ncbi:recombinase family protein [Methylorubrum populi]|uniref:Recombinase family protein n=1 Tax=Methylorubrum populi TaxID=223967 RepID=A0A833N2J3_9HYPH|nr:recombinase family protein [Methylorubrum populi]KAB7783959.1 hypothetical protein F8B43_3882 [Methylorubrum populi]
MSTSSYDNGNTRSGQPFVGSAILGRVPWAAPRVDGPPPGTPVGAKLIDLLPEAWVSKRSPVPSPAHAAPRGVRAAIYTRYSTTGQSQSSTERQIEVCMDYARRIGVVVDRSDVFSDEGFSGSSMKHRTRLNALLDKVAVREVDMVIIEDADRMARDLADLAWMFKYLKKHGSSLHQAKSGPMNATEVAFRGVMSQEQKDFIVWRTEQGRRAMVLRGLHPAGRCFGYRRVLGSPGLLVKDEELNDTIVRIFEMRADGVSFSAICVSLNAAGIKSPRGLVWVPVMLRTVLTNPLYRGVLVWARLKHEKDFDENVVRVTRRPKEEWLVHPVPHLQIVSEELWNAAQSVDATKQTRVQRGGPILRRYLLSGRALCPSCGGKMHILEKRHIACANAIQRRTCHHRARYHLDWAEGLVLSALADQLESPDLHRPFVDALNEEARRVEKETASDRKRLQRQVDLWTKRVDATFDEDHTRGAQPESIVRNRQRFESCLTEARDALAALPRLRGMLEFDTERLGGMAASLRNFAKREVKYVHDEATARVIEAARGCFDTVTLEQVEGGVRFGIAFRVDVLLGTSAVGQAPDTFRRLEFVVPLALCRGLGASVVQRRARGTASFAEGPWRLSDDEWADLRDLVPASLVSHRIGLCSDPRSLVELMLAKMVHGRRLADCPEGFGELKAVTTAFRRTIAGGHWDRIVDRLTERAPHHLRGYDPNRFRCYWNTYKKRRGARRVRGAGEPGRPAGDVPPGGPSFGILRPVLASNLLS